MATCDALTVTVLIFQKRNLRLRGEPQVFSRPDLILPLGLMKAAPPAGLRDSLQPTEVRSDASIQLSPWTPELLARPQFFPDPILLSPRARVDVSLGSGPRTSP